MYFVIDAMLPRDLAEFLIAEGHKASTVTRLKLGSDETIWQFVQKNNAVLITKDSDYLPLVSKNSTTQLIHFKGGNHSTAQLIQRFRIELPQVIEALLTGEKFVELR